MQMIGVIEQLPFLNQTIVVVLSTVMMHHLPDSLKRQGLAEIASVLKPVDLLVIADFTPKKERKAQAARFHAGWSSMQDLVAMAVDTGFDHMKTEEMQPLRFSAFPGAGFVCAHKSEDQVTY